MFSRGRLVLGGFVCAALTVGCARTDQPVVETGCLTSSGDRFVLTSLETGATTAQPETELYQLVGADDELRGHVGKAVRISGELDDPATVADVRETSPATPTGTSGRGAGYEAKVETTSTTRIETHRLKVHSVTPTGESCETAD